MHCFFCYLTLLLKTYLQYSFDITAEHSFRYMKLADAKIPISKKASCWVFANRTCMQDV